MYLLMFMVGGTQDKLVQSVMVLLELYYKLVTITDQH